MTSESVTVPREPTEAMIEAGHQTDVLLCRPDARTVWTAMLAAAPPATPPVQGGAVDDGVVSALREAFPDFEGDASITPDRIRKIGDAHLKMLMDTGPSEIDFTDNDGATRKIVWDGGDWEAGISAGWSLDDESLSFAPPPVTGEGVREAVARLAEIAAAVEFAPGDGVAFREAGAVKLAADIRTTIAALTPAGGEG